MTSNQKRAILALLLLIPAPTLGNLCGMVFFPDTALGTGLFFGSKVWVLLFPVVWHLLIDKQKFSWSRPSNGGFLVASILGIVISAVILVAYFTMGSALVDVDTVAEKMRDIGLSKLHLYLLCAGYWILVNSVLEEYVWRWFVVQQCQKLVSPVWAVLLSAFGFTIHHVFAMREFFDLTMVLIATLGIFIGAAAWSWCYVRYKSIWPGYISHVFVDVAIFAIGYDIIFIQ